MFDWRSNLSNKQTNNIIKSHTIIASLQSWSEKNSVVLFAKKRVENEQTNTTKKTLLKKHLNKNRRTKKVRPNYNIYESE